MQTIANVQELQSLYGEAVPVSLEKVWPHISPLYRQWIEASQFVVLSTVGPSGTDASPRGDDGAVVQVIDENTLWLPDWRGNNRLDSLRNVVEDGRVSLMFMVPGCNNVVRVNGRAVLTVDEDVTQQFNKGGKQPRSVIVITVGEIYFQCAKALMRSKLWQDSDQSDQVPTAGQFMKERLAEFDAQAYDSGYAENAKDRMW